MSSLFEKRSSQQANRQISLSCWSCGGVPGRKFCMLAGRFIPSVEDMKLLLMWMLKLLLMWMLKLSWHDHAE